MATNAEIQALQTYLVDKADDAVAAVPGYVNTAITASQSQVSPNLPQDVVADVPDIPFMGNSYDTLSRELLGQYGDIFNSLSPWLQGQFEGWLAQWVPVVDPCIQPTIDAWICDTINNGGTGIPPAVEAAIWERARAREVLEANRMTEEAMYQFAARGFSLPPGVLANRAMMIQQDAANKSASISRDTAIKNVEIEIENVRFAVSEGNKLRTVVAQAVADFLRTMLLIPKTAVDYATGMAAAQAQLYNSLNAYYNALVAAEELDVRAQIANQNTAVQIQQIDIQSFGYEIDASVKAAIAAANVMGNQASAALSGINTLAAAVDSDGQ